MEAGLAGALYAAEHVLEGAVALAKGITHPTLPLKANLTRITSVPVPRSHHTISVVKGRAYIFGGETAPGELADNTMHVVILPSSGVLEADYTTYPARPADASDEVPAPRKGHTAVTIGNLIYIFGGEGTKSEHGRIWAYNTETNTWRYLDPSPGTLFPSQRSGHASASSDMPAPKDEITYKESTPQQPADPAKVVPEPADDDSYGTIFVVGGKATENGELLNDGLAFDVRTRTWSNIPTPPGQPREGASLALVRNRIYRFGGKGVETFSSGGLEYLDVSPVFKHAEGGTTPLNSGWAWEELAHVDAKDVSAPQARSGTGLVPVTTGQGRHYLLAIGGEGEAPLQTTPASNFFDDIWAFQLPSERATGASIKDITRNAAKKDSSNEARWAEAQYKYLDDKGDEEKEIPGQPRRGLGVRGHFAVAKGTEVDGASVVAWGGIDGEGKVLGDGWLITADR